nr:hypothetical protein [Tanacetum cinerariifolium]GFA64820.1 hypothetical protein [Tanacetum cinerariifolium]
MNTSTSGISSDVAKLKDMVKAILLDKKSQNQSPAPVKAVEESCVTYGGAHSYRNCPATDGNVYRDNIQEFISQASVVNYNQGNTNYRPPMIASTSSSGTLPSNTISNLRSHLKSITTRSGVSYYGPHIPPPPSFLPKVVEDEQKATKGTMNPTNNGSTEDVQPHVVQSKSTSEPVNSPISEPKISPIFKDMSFKISFADALILMPKFASTLKALIGNKENLTLADLGASINLMPFSVWKRLSLSDLTPTCMTLELADRLISHPVGVAEDVYVKVGSFHFPVDFVVVDFDADPRVPLILGRSFLKTERALIDVFKEDFLNNDPSPPPQGNYLPQARKELKIYEAKFDKSFIDEPPEVELSKIYLPTSNMHSWKVTPSCQSSLQKI